MSSVEQLKKDIYEQRKKLEVGRKLPEYLTPFRERVFSRWDQLNIISDMAVRTMYVSRTLIDNPKVNLECLKEMLSAYSYFFKQKFEYFELEIPFKIFQRAESVFKTVKNKKELTELVEEMRIWLAHQNDWVMTIAPWEELQKISLK